MTRKGARQGMRNETRKGTRKETRKVMRNVIKKCDSDEEVFAEEAHGHSEKRKKVAYMSRPAGSAAAATGEYKLICKLL